MCASIDKSESLLAASVLIKVVSNLSVLYGLCADSKLRTMIEPSHAKLKVWEIQIVRDTCSMTSNLVVALTTDCASVLRSIEGDRL